MAGIAKCRQHEVMQISRAYLTNPASMAFVARRNEFLSRVILEVNVQESAVVDNLDSPERIAALAEAERLLKEVANMFDQRFE